MPRQDIIAIGASAGGVQALQVLTAGLPAELQAAVLIVLHIGSGISGHSYLPEILSKAGPLPAGHPSDGEQIGMAIFILRPRITTCSSIPDACASYMGQRRTTRGQQSTRSSGRLPVPTAHE